MTEPPSPGRNKQDVSRRTILDRIAGKWRAKATCVAVERGLPAMLKEGPRAPEEVALQPHGEQPKQEALQHLIPACRAALPGVSVAICTYNGAARLPTTLAYLAAQRVSPSVAWEVLVIDNASTDDTAGVVRAAWPPGSPAPLRLVAEPLLGLAHARARAFAEARFEFVSFVDDDNWVSPDWVDIVGEIMSAHADVAACGGDSEAVSEHPLPVWFSRHAGMLAVGRQGDVAGDSPGLLWGAGLTVRASAWEALRARGFQHLLIGRCGSTATSGEDLELCAALRLSGWRLWYDPRLSMRHFLPLRRLRWAYVRSLYYGWGLASPWLDPYLMAGSSGGARHPLLHLWTWRLLAALLRLVWSAVKAAMTWEEASQAVGRFEVCRGRLRGLLAVRRSWHSNRRRVRGAAWHRRTRGPGVPPDAPVSSC